MRRPLLWREFESGNGVVLRLLRFLVFGGGLLFLCYTAVLPLTWKSQLRFAAIVIAVAFWVKRSAKSHVGTLTLLLLSLYSTFRYGFWRAATIVAFFRDPFSHWSATDAAFILTLFSAELFAFTTLALSYVQVLWPLHRMPVPLPDDPAVWPAIDLLIPTFNEPLSVLRPTALAAINIDWPPEKLNVYILDDGNREQVRAFAEEAGIGYIARTQRTHAKAGNINNALGQLNSPYVAVFDCDHVPTRSFLQLTMGWLLRDQKLAMLQTPHHFYSPDPFERNLDQFRAVPTEGELFYRVIQDGNDFWNATSFCGSCAILRRSSLDQVGGFATETLTEDVHTSLRLQMHGWNTAYINIPQAAGLATERLSGYIRQRIRWARGMLQVLRLENPLTAPGLTGGQRLCYFHGMAHFLFPLPRLIFLTAPLLYLLLGRTVMPGFWGAILAYALPHLVLSSVCASCIQREHRHAFWDHVYETVLAPFLLLPTLGAFFSPRSHQFDVTPKGGTVDHDYFDSRIAWPFLLMLAFNIVGVLCAIARLVRLPHLRVPAQLAFLNWPAHLYAPHQTGIVAVNLIWVLFNIVLVGVAVAVARETQQRRESVRLAVQLPSDIILANGSMLQGVTSDLSYGGVRTYIHAKAEVTPGDAIKFVFPLLDGTATIPATVISHYSGDLRARFDNLSLQEDEALVTLLYSRADSWLNWSTNPHPRHPIHSLARIARLSLRGCSLSLRRRKPSLVTTIAPLLLLAFVFTPRAITQSQGTPGFRAAKAWKGNGPSLAQTSEPPNPASSSTQTPTTAAPAAPTQNLGVPSSPGSRPIARPRRDISGESPSQTPATFAQVLTLSDLGLPTDAMLRGNGSSHRLRFFIARDRLVRTADFKLRYRTAPGLLATTSHIIVTLNGTVVATLPVSTSSTAPTEVTLTLPAELLRHENRLAFEFIGHYSTQCEDPANTSVWAQIDPVSMLELSGARLTMTTDLASLPLPFYDAGGSRHASIPIVFAMQPSPRAMQAAAIIASWFGSLAGSSSGSIVSPQQLRFPVSIGTIPVGNAIVLAEGSAQLPAALKDVGTSGAAIAIHANPSDSTSSVLLVSGTTSDDLLTASRALVLHQATWQGTRVVIRNFVPPAPRQPDDAPRWLRTDTLQTFGEMARASHETEASADTFQTDGSNLITVPLKLPPDLDFADRENLPLRLDYRYNSVPLGEGSTLEVYLNGNFISATPMPHADRASRVLETLVPVPVADLRPFNNTLQFRFLFRRAATRDCFAPPTIIDAAIVPDSSLDITGISHSAVLPNLALFSTAGFPFTRFADLAETTVVLPNTPTPSELESLLILVSHFGAQTGYPVLRLSITNPAGLSADRAHDYLILGTPQDQPAFQTLADSMPVQVDSSGMHVRPPAGLLNPRRWWSQTTGPQSGELLATGGLPDALIQEFNWPARSSRSVVAIVLRDDSTAADAFTAALAAAGATSGIARDVSTLRDGRFSPYSVAALQYRVGENTPLERLTRTLQQFPWIVAVVATLFCFLMAALLQAHLRRRARQRLHPRTSSPDL